MFFTISARTATPPAHKVAKDGADDAPSDPPASLGIGVMVTEAKVDGVMRQYPISALRSVGLGGVVWYAVGDLENYLCGACDYQPRPAMHAL